MDATEEIRHLLDKRGVKWKPKRGFKDTGTVWHDGLGWTKGYRCEAEEQYTEDGVGDSTKLWVRTEPRLLTPEQAIVTTLGPGTCRMKLRRNPYRDFLHEYTCSECGETMCKHTFFGKSEPPRWCPNCGRKVIDE